MANSLKNPVSLFPMAKQKRAKGQSPKPQDNPRLIDVLRRQATSPQLKDLGEKFAAIEDKDAQRLFKATKVPCITPSATFTGRSICEPKEHSTFILADVDNVEPDAVPRIKKWAADVGAAAAATSISGRGVAIYFHLPHFAGARGLEGAVKDDERLEARLLDERHKAAFADMEQWFAEQELDFTIAVDSACREVCRLRYVSYDPDIYINMGELVGFDWGADFDEEAFLNPQASTAGQNGATSGGPATDDQPKSKSYRDRRWTYEELREALTYIEGTLYEEWLPIIFAMGHAVVEELVSEEEGKELLVEWSAAGGKDRTGKARTAKDVDDRWADALDRRGTKRAKIGTIISRAKKGGWVPPKKTPGRPSANPGIEDAASRLADHCAETGDFKVLGKVAYHYDEASGLFVEKETPATLAAEAMLYLPDAGLNPTDAIRKAVGGFLLGALLGNTQHEAQPADFRYWPFRDYILDVETWERLDYSRDLFFTERLDYNPLDLDDPANAEEVAKGRDVLDRWLVGAFRDDEMRQAGQDQLATMLFAPQQFEQIFLWEGITNNGKSTMFDFGLKTLLGRGLCATVDEIKANTPDGYEKVLYDLLGKRLACVLDAKRGLPPAMASMLVSKGDTVRARKLYANQVEFNYKGALLVITNLGLDFSDPGLARRVEPLRFDAQPKDDDPQFGQRLYETRAARWSILFEHYKQRIKGQPTYPRSEGVEAIRRERKQGAGSAFQRFCAECLAMGPKCGPTKGVKVVEWYLQWQDSGDPLGTGVEGKDLKEGKRKQRNLIRRESPKVPGFRPSPTHEGCYTVELRRDLEPAPSPKPPVVEPAVPLVEQPLEQAPLVGPDDNPYGIAPSGADDYAAPL